MTAITSQVILSIVIFYALTWAFYAVTKKLKSKFIINYVPLDFSAVQAQFGTLNNEQMELFKRSVKNAQYLGKFLIAVAWLISMYCGYFLALTLTQFMGDKGYFGMLLIPGFIIWGISTKALVELANVEIDKILLSLIRKKGTTLQCPECGAYFAITIDEINRVLIAAVPRQSKRTTNRNSNGNRTVTESYWTEARYTVTKKKSCVQCDYTHVYEISETKQENKSSSTYQE